MKLLLFITLILSLVFTSCDPLSLEEDKRSNERDVVADVQSVVSPDSVQSGVSFTVQLSFPKICGGTFRYNIISADTSNNIFIEPIVHVVQQATCPTVVEYMTVTAPIKITATGQYTIVGVGDFGTIRKSVVVLNAVPSPATYRLSYKFQNRSGDPIRLYASTLQLTNLTPVQSFSFVTDTLGRWDTTFTNGSTTLNYTLNAYQFTAKQGIKENGIIIIP